MTVSHASSQRHPPIYSEDLEIIRSSRMMTKILRIES